MEATEQDLLATQKALEEEVQNKVKEAVMDNFLRVSFIRRISKNYFFLKGKINSGRKIHRTKFI
jgi:hypothetical protein